MDFLLIILGLFILFISGEFLIRGAVSVAKSLKISNFVIGLTIVAYGTSAPELVVSAKAVIEGYSGLAVGNVIGSNISNILFVIGVAAFIFPVTINPIARKDSFFLLSITCLFAFLALFGFGLITGIIFLSILVIYSYRALKTAREESEIIEEVNPFFSGIAILFGIIGLYFGSEILIDASVNLAVKLGISQEVIGLTILAFGSSVPELATSVVAAFRKHSDIAVSNVIGSNIFNILGVIGFSSVIAKMPVENSLIYYDIPILLIVTIFFIIAIFIAKINRIAALLMISSYLLYVYSLF